MENITLIHGFVLAVLFVSVFTDLKSQRISNALTLPMWPVGILWHAVLSSDPWYFGLLGFAVAFPLHFLLWFIGLDKGGDAKLMIGIGACLGWVTMLEATIWAILAMLPVGLVFVTLRGKLGNFWRSVKYLFMTPYYKAMKLDPGPQPEQTYMPKAPVIAIATVLAITTNLVSVYVIGW